MGPFLWGDKTTWEKQDGTAAACDGDGWSEVGARTTLDSNHLGHVTDHLGEHLVVEITPTAVKSDRLAEKAGPKTINDEVLLLIRLCGDQSDLVRAKLRRESALKLALPPSPGRAYTADEKVRMLAEAQKLRSKNIYPAQYWT